MSDETRELLPCPFCGSIWNKVQREGEHFFCPTCFTVLAEERGINPTGWLVRPENVQDGELAKTLAASQPVGDVPVPVETLNVLYEQTGGAFGPDPDAYGRAVEAEYQRLNPQPVGLVEPPAGFGEEPPAREMDSYESSALTFVETQCQHIAERDGKPMNARMIWDAGRAFEASVAASQPVGDLVEAANSEDG